MQKGSSVLLFPWGYRFGGSVPLREEKIKFYIFVINKNGYYSTTIVSVFVNKGGNNRRTHGAAVWRLVVMPAQFCFVQCENARDI